jgi:hypothetical protein
MSDTKQLLERAWRQASQPDRVMDSLIRRRDRKRRNQRIAAGVVGIAAFVAAVWIVTSGLSWDRSEKPAASGPAETAPLPAPASAASTCSDGATLRLELTDIGDRIKVRVEVHRSPVGHSWRTVVRHARPGRPLNWHHTKVFKVFFDGTLVASESGDLAAQRSVKDHLWRDGYVAKARDMQTGQFCSVVAVI